MNIVNIRDIYEKICPDLSVSIVSRLSSLRFDRYCSCYHHKCENSLSHLYSITHLHIIIPPVKLSHS